MKISPTGNLLWSVKDTLDIYDGYSKLWIDRSGNIFHYLVSNVWRDESHMQKFDRSGKQIWKTPMNYIFPYAIEVNGAGETYYSCKIFKNGKNGFPLNPHEGERQEVWKLDAEGKKSVILSQKCPKTRKNDQYTAIEGDYFVNQIAFNADDTPVFFCSILMQHKCEYIVVMGKKYEEENGSFVFAEIGSDGKIISDLQLKVTALIFERDYNNYRDVGITKRHGAIYCGSRKWIFAVPVSVMQTVRNPASTYFGEPLTYVTYSANTRSIAYERSKSMYIENYHGVRFSYLPDSTLLTYGKRKDEDIPTKPNHTFYWMYIERTSLKLHVEQINAVVPFTVDSIVEDPIVKPLASKDSDLIVDPVRSYRPLLYPNPTNANSLFQFVMPETTTEGTEANFTVIDGQGKILESRMIQVSAGENKVEVLSAGFSMGTYTVSVTSGAMEFHMVLIKI